MVKRFIASMLVIACLLLLCPSPANADTLGLDDFYILYGLCVILLGCIIWYFIDNDNGPDEAGEMFFSLTGHELPSQPMGFNPISFHSTAHLDHNLNILLTDKTEDNFWLSTGITFNFIPDRETFAASEIAYGPNLEFGYTAEDLETKLHFFFLSEDRSHALLEFIYRY